MVKVAVCGANGKMGKEVVKMVKESPNLQLIATIDINDADYTSIEEACKNSEIDVLVDFTNPDSVYKNAMDCLHNGVRPVIGTTGLSDEQIENLKKLTSEKGIGCFIAPNFSTGAVLMMEFAKKAAKYFDNAEIIELHHNQKKDAPSGTAVKTAKMMSESKESFTNGNCLEKELIKGSRGGDSYSNIQDNSVKSLESFSNEYISTNSQEITTIRNEAIKMSVPYFYYVEFHKFISIPAACLFMVFIGAPLGIVGKRSGKGFGFGISVIVVVIYYLLITAAEIIAGNRTVPAFFAMWFPNIVLAVIGAFFMITSFSSKGR